MFAELTRPQNLSFSIIVLLLSKNSVFVAVLETCWFWYSVKLVSQPHPAVHLRNQQISLQISTAVSAGM